MSKGFVFGCFLGVFVLATLQRANGEGFFKIINKIPHLPVVNNAEVAIASPIAGNIVYDSNVNNVRIYDGANWISICDVADAVANSPTSFSIKGGIPALAVGDDPGTWTPSSGDAYFSILKKAFLVHDGTGFVEISEFNTFPENTGSGVTNDGKLLKIPIRSSTPISGVQNGAICFKTNGRLQVYYNSSWNELFCCPPSIIVDHRIVNEVAPVDTTITYEVVKYDNKCWLAQNLGAGIQAGLGTDEASRGWYWQFNRKQGYEHDGIDDGNDATDGVSRKPGVAWSDATDENKEWLSVNDPCTIEMGAGWEVPNDSDWTSAISGWSSYNDAYNSPLKIYAASNLNKAGLMPANSIGDRGYYWSSTQSNDYNAYSFEFFTSLTLTPLRTYDKDYGFSVRCVHK